LHQPFYTPQSHILDPLGNFRTIKGLYGVVQRANAGRNEKVQRGVEGKEGIVDDDTRGEGRVVDADFLAFFRGVPGVPAKQKR